MTGVIGVIAVAGLGVILAVLSGQVPAPPPARPVAVDLGAAATPARPVPGSPAADPFFPPETAPQDRASERPETEPERAADHREETGETVTRDGAENNPGNGPEKGQPAKERPVREQRASRRDAPPGREIESSRSSRRPAPAASPSSGSRSPSTASSSRGGGGGSTGGDSGTDEARQPRPARMDTRQQTARGSTTDSSAAEATKAETTAAKDTDASGAASTRVEDPCLQFDDELRRAYCYEVLRALGQ
ncbi:hypothetical protein AB0C14_15540 [Microbispora hainanensis]|uniref:hypothetical protein n=1 Tax=Microbispora hainanensis TaxID=568844 RepID=UPI0033F242F1